jgi:hypothetical protein
VAKAPVAPAVPSAATEPPSAAKPLPPPERKPIPAPAERKAPAAKAAAAPPPAKPAAAPAERVAAATPAPRAEPPAPKAEAPREEEPPTGFWRDQGITTKVAGKLQFNRRLWRTGIQVETKAGVVTLRGQVPSQDLIDEAVRLAREVYGVRAVRNELKIGQPDFSSSPGSGG